MLSTIFFLISVLSMMLIVIYFAIGVRIIFRKDSPLSGLQAVISALLLVVIVWVTFIAGINADESHHYLEYEKYIGTQLVGVEVLPNLYSFHTLPNIILTSLIALSILIGLQLFTDYKVSVYEKKKVLTLKSVEHVEWMNSLHDAMLHHRYHSHE